MEDGMEDSGGRKQPAWILDGDIRWFSFLHLGETPFPSRDELGSPSKVAMRVSFNSNAVR